MSIETWLAGCLGKHPPRNDPRTLSFSSVVDVALLKAQQLEKVVGGLPVAPPSRDWTTDLPANLGMFANDMLGDCTCASAAHLLQVWSDGKFQPTDDEVVAAYCRLGYVPGDPKTDNGANMLDVLNLWRTEGICGKKIGAYAKIDITDLAEVRVAINLTGGIYVGAALPRSASDLTKPWQGKSGKLAGDDAPGSWGGHCMAVCEYDQTGVGFLTWARRKLGDWPWFLDYVDEAYAIFDEDWIRPDGNAPSGVSAAAIQAFLAAVA
jgi:hypothetical protein